MDGRCVKLIGEYLMINMRESFCLCECVVCLLYIFTLDTGEPIARSYTVQIVLFVGFSLQFLSTLFCKTEIHLCSIHLYVLVFMYNMQLCCQRALIGITNKQTNNKNTLSRLSVVFLIFFPIPRTLRRSHLCGSHEVFK